MDSITFVFGLLILRTNTVSCTTEKKLIDHLLDKYEPLTRPVVPDGLPITISIGLTLHQLIQINEKAQILTSSVLFHLDWTDPGLKWNPSDFGNISHLKIPVKRIWYPDIKLVNRVEDDNYASQEADFNAFIKSSGKIIHVRSVIFKSSCKMDVTWFPFDVQICHLHFGSWTYSGLEADLQLLPYGADMSNFLEHGEWNVLKLTSERSVKYYECCPSEPYILIKFNIEMKRRTLYYFFNLIVPCGLIGFLAVLGFTLPPDSGEKLTLGVTVLFSLIVFLNMISVSMPANSGAVPLLGTYFTCVMVIIASSVLSTILVNLNARSMSPLQEMSGLKKRILLEWLPKLLLMRPFEKELQNLKPERKENEETHELKEVKDPDKLRANHQFTDRGGKAIGRLQWKFAALVIDRASLLASMLFTILATIFLLVTAF